MSADSYAKEHRSTRDVIEKDHAAVSAREIGAGKEHAAVSAREVDSGAALLAGADVELDEAEAIRIRCELWLRYRDV
jgi:hypothetical protein